MRGPAPVTGADGRGRRRGRRAGPALAFALAAIAAACGTGVDEVSLDEPVPTLFPSTVPGGEAEAPVDPGSTVVSPDGGLDEDSAPVVAPLDHDGRARVLLLPAGVTVPVLAALDDGSVEVRGPCGNRVRLDATATAGAVSVDAAHLVVDPAHGGADPGVVGPDGIGEADQNLELARLLVDALAARGVEAVPTRTADVDLAVEARVAVAAALDAPLVVIGHHTADPGAPDAVRGPDPGVEVWYRTGDAASRRLGGLVHEELAAALAALGGPWWHDDEAGVVHRLNQRAEDLRRPLALADGPAVVVEVAAWGDADEARRLATGEARARIADAVAAGVARWLGSDDPGSGYRDLQPEVVEAPALVTPCVDVLAGLAAPAGAPSDANDGTDRP
ncbi:MAG: hypothetical protein D6683_11555 [Actinomyces sp.]|nr:MAG: hypothetical protein D6683_11555 [Actinomyces sp.]